MSDIPIIGEPVGDTTEAEALTSDLGVALDVIACLWAIVPDEVKLDKTAEVLAQAVAYLFDKYEWIEDDNE